MLLFVNTLLDNGLSNRGIAASAVQAELKLDPDVVGRHKANHWVKPERLEGPKPTKRDLAILVRDKTYDAVEDLSPDAMLILGPQMAPIIGKGLQAQSMLDKREEVAKKLGLAAGALALQGWLAGLGASVAEPAELGDGDVIEGEAHEVA